MKTMDAVCACVLAAVLVATAGCDSMSHRDKTTAVGAGAGAVGGAVLTGGSTAATVGGAVVGGVIGHEVGDNDKDHKDKKD